MCFGGVLPNPRRGENSTFSTIRCLQDARKSSGIPPSSVFPSGRSLQVVIPEMLFSTRRIRANVQKSQGHTTMNTVQSWQQKRTCILIAETLTRVHRNQRSCYRITGVRLT